MLLFATQGMTSLPLAVSLHSGTSNSAWLAVGALGSAFFAVVIAWIVSLAVRRPWIADPMPAIVGAAGAITESGVQQ